MISDQEKQFLLDEYQICSSRRKPFTKYIDREFSKRNPEAYKKIMEYTSYMHDKYCFEHRLFMYINEYQNFPICSKCNKPNINKIKSLNGYTENDLICHRCYSVQKVKDTMLKKYGVSNASQIESIKQKKIRTCTKHYGVTNPSKCADIQKKKVITNNIRYGADCITQTENFKMRCKETLRSKYGVNNVSQIQEVKNKKKKTCFNHFGVSFPTQSEKVRFKIKKKIESNPDFYDNRLIKQHSTCISKYGTTHWMKIDKYKIIIKEKLLRKVYDKLLKSKYVIPLFDDNYYIKNSKNELMWKCKKCGNEFTTIDNGCVLNEPLYVRCPKCYPLKTKQTSSYEDEIYVFLKDLNIDCTKNDKKAIYPYELDIYVESKQLAIEFDGLYWHNETRKTKNYHLDKTKLCESKGIQLIHIFEDEWIYQKDIVKSRLKNLFGIYDSVIYARKCEIKEINDDSYIEFLDDNHIQKSIRSSFKFGLYFDNQLVSIMTFGQNRKALGSKSIEDEYELLRFCNKLGYHIPGAASKLLKYFIRNYQPKKIISYCDRRWSQGNLYKKIGFSLISESDPNYWYIINGHREHRFNWRKSELPKKLKNVDMSKTEHEIMIENNIFRIYDCGSYKFEFL